MLNAKLALTVFFSVLAYSFSFISPVFGIPPIVESEQNRRKLEIQNAPTEVDPKN